MLLQEIKEIDVSRKAIRSFGLVVGGVLILIAGIIWWRQGWDATGVTYGFGGTGIVLIVLGLVIPMVLRPLYRVWMALALVLGFIMTRVILTLVFFLLITPIGLVRRLLGKDPLRAPPEEHATSYWIPKSYDDPSSERLEKYY